MTCRIDGCERDVFIKKWSLCLRHYGSERAAGRINTLRPHRPTTCDVDQCERPMFARGWCQMHYSRAKINDGDPMVGGRLRRVPGVPCVVDGCDRDKYHLASGWCHLHYERMRRRGSLEPPRKGLTERWTDSDGYVWVSVAGRGRVQEHRVVMERRLGRPLTVFEQVHHVNGVKGDNSPENLELWVRSQPCGARVEDLVHWVVSEYPDLVSAALGRPSLFLVS